MRTPDKPCEDSGEFAPVREPTTPVAIRARFASAFLKALFATSLVLITCYGTMYAVGQGYALFRHSEARLWLWRPVRDLVEMALTIGFFGLGWFVVPGAASFVGLTRCAKSSHEIKPRLAGVYISYLLLAVVLFAISGPNWIALTVAVGVLPFVSSMPWTLVGVLRLKLLPK